MGSRPRTGRKLRLRSTRHVSPASRKRRRPHSPRIETLENRMLLHGGSMMDVSNYAVAYSLDEGQGGLTGDVAANVAAATVAGAQWTLDSPSDSGFALAFDGIDDRLEVPDDSDINTHRTRTNYTISLWFKAVDASGPDHQVLWEQGGQVNGMNLYLQNGSLYAGAWSEGSGWNGAWASSANVADGAWHHAAMTLDSQSGELKLYLDGALEDTVAAESVRSHPGNVAAGGVDNDTKFHDTGDYSPNTGKNFHGLIDEIRLYDGTLSMHDVQILSLAGQPGMPHGDDAGKMSEHMALMDLIRRTDATHVAVQSGDWSDPAIWMDGQVPTTGATVLIVDGRTVTYDTDDSVTRLFGVRVDGKLQWATDSDTHMVVDTLIVSPSGELEIGTAANPVASDVQARISIGPVDPTTSNAYDIDTDWDWHQLSRGLVSHGKATIHGAEKTTFAQLDQDALAGDQSIQLATPVSGWNVGDRLVLTGTEFIKDDFNNGNGVLERPMQTEVLTITAISPDGRTISFAETLAFDHIGHGTDILGRPMMPYVANYSRNVLVETENHENLAANQRGHVMFMHNPEVDIRYAEFFELGRTDKKTPLDDFQLNGRNRVLDENGDPIPGARTNIRGRYAFHLHRTGVQSQDITAKAIGNSVWGSPGWGFVHHDSHADFNWNASYDVDGAHFVAEVGSETGDWNFNIAIKADGRAAVNGGVSKGGAGNHDNGTGGHGYFMQSRVVHTEGNVAADMDGVGYVFFTRGVDELPNVAEFLEHPAISGYGQTFGPDSNPIEHFKDNVAISSRQGFNVIKANPNQKHDVHSHIDGFTAWEVETVSNTQYTGSYVFTDLTGVSARENGGGTAISMGNSVFGMSFNHIQLEDFGKVFHWNGNDTIAGVWNYRVIEDYGFTFVDVQLIDTPDVYTIDGRDVASHVHVYSSADLTPGRLELDVDMTRSNLDADAGRVVIGGTKTDSIGPVDFLEGHLTEVSFRTAGLRNRAIEAGYWTRPSDGQSIVLVEVPIADRATAAVETVLVEVEWDNIPAEAVYNGVWEGTLPPAIPEITSTATVSQTVRIRDDDGDGTGDSMRNSTMIGRFQGDDHRSVISFQLPTDVDIADLSDSDLSVFLDRKINIRAGDPNVDLLAVRTSATPGVVNSDFQAAATLIEDDLLTPDVAVNTTAALSDAGRSSLTAWLAANAAPGDYVFFRLQFDAASTTNWDRYQLAEVGQIGEPMLTVTGPELTPLLAAGGIGQEELVTLENRGQIAQLINAARQLWVDAGHNPRELAGLRYQIRDLGTGVLATYRDGVISLDDDASGYGWFIDDTPTDDAEFDSAGPAGMDLLTTVLHEMGHHLGMADAYAEEAAETLMYGWLEAGQRRGIGPS